MLWKLISVSLVILVVITYTLIPRPEFECKDPHMTDIGLEFFSCPYGIDALEMMFMEAYEYFDDMESLGFDFSALDPSKEHVIFDIGANIGHVGFVSDWKIPNVVVHSFEPDLADPVPYRNLEKNIKHHNLTKKIFPYNVAMSSSEKEGKMIFYSNPSNTVLSSLIEYDDQMFLDKEGKGSVFDKQYHTISAFVIKSSPILHFFFFRIPILKSILKLYFYHAFYVEPKFDEIEVTVSSISSVLTSEKEKNQEIKYIDFLFIDTEGSEWDILQDIPQSEFCDRVGHIAMEVHLLKEFDYDPVRLGEHIKLYLESLDCGYEVFIIDKATEMGQRIGQEHFQFPCALYAFKRE